MSLQKQIVPMSFSQGLDTKTDPKQVSPGKLLLLKNAHFQESKELKKRFGYEAYPTAIQGSAFPVTTGISTFSYKNEILIQDKNALLSYSPDQTWVTKSINLRNFDYDVKSVQFDSLSKSNPVGSYDPVNDLEFYVYTNKEFNSNLLYTIIEKSTGNIIADNVILDTEVVTNIQVQYLSGQWVVFYTINQSATASQSLRYVIVDPAAPLAVVTPIQITATLTVNQNFDSTKVGNEVFIAVSETGSLVRIYRMTSAFVVSLRRSLVGPAVTFTVALHGNVSTRIVVLYCDPVANDTYVKIFDDSNTGGPEPTQYTIDATRAAQTATLFVDSLGDAKIFIYHAGNATYPRENAIVRYDFTNLNVASAPTIVSCGLLLQSKVFLYQNYLYYFACPTASSYINANENTIYNTSQYGLYLMGFDFVNLNMVCYEKAESGTYGFDRDPNVLGQNPIRSLPEVCLFSESGTQKFLFAYLKKSRTIVLNEQISYLHGVQTIHSFQSTKAVDRELIAQSLCFTGGQLFQYDGSDVVESGFNIFPSLNTTFSQDTIGGGIGSYGLTPDPTVQIVGVYEWTDQNGQLHRSAPSDPLPIKMVDSTEPVGARPVFNFTGIQVYGGPQLPPGRSFVVNTTGFDNPINLAVGDTVTDPTAYPGGTVVERIYTEDEAGAAGLGPNGLVIFTTVGAGTFGSTYSFTRAATAFAAGIYPINTTNGSKMIQAAGGGIFHVGQRIKSVTGAPAGLPANAIITRDYGTGFYDIDLAATATAAINTWTPDSKSYYIGIRNISLTNKNNISLVLYRTKVNGSIYFRTTSVVIPIINNKQQFQTVIKISDSDGEIEANEQLYTSGGEVENIAPPAFDSVQFYKNRIMGVRKDNKSEIWYSKQVIPGYGLEFNDSFVLNVNAPGGDVTATAVLDEKFITYKGDEAYYMLGEGPNPMGLQNDFTPFQLINSDKAGCKKGEEASVVNIPEGVMVKTNKGIYLLNRSMGFDYIGDAVEDFNQFTIISSRVMKTVHQVRFGLSNGQFMTYDYYHKQWSTHEGQGDSLSQNDAENINGVYHFLSSSGILKKETTAFADSRTVSGVQTPSYIPMSLDTGWFSFAGIEAFQRVYKAILLGDYKSNHNLVMQVYYDFDENYFDTIPINNINPALAIYAYRLHMPRQKCTSIRYKIIESQYLTTIGEGLTISSISFEVGVKKGLNKIRASQSFG
jgi:hypothetical protein